jgi:hypothetical protein
MFQMRVTQGKTMLLKRLIAVFANQMQRRTISNTGFRPGLRSILAREAGIR